MLIFRRVAFWVFLALGLLLARGYWNATRDPIVRTAYVKVADWPTGAPPVRMLLLSDIHVSGPEMPPARMAEIARKLNALKPDLILIAGDLVSTKRLATHIYTTAEVVAPLRALHAPLGVVVTLGNHDHWYDEAGFRRALPEAGLTLLANQAVKRGPLVIGGVDDDFTGHADIQATIAAMDAFDGPRILLTHSPDIVPALPIRVAAVLAGHTHCSQIQWPWGKPLVYSTRYGDRFNCGFKRDRGQTVIVSAGLGTSVIWLRYGAPPDVWLVTLGP